MGFGQVIILLVLMFQMNQEHPPISVKLNRAEMMSMRGLTIEELFRVQRQLIEQHQPPNEPKPSCKPTVEGYRGRIYRPEDIIYVWEVPKCSR